MKNNKILILLVLFISIGFAAIATLLDIDGYARLMPQSWDVYFDNLVAETAATNSITIDEEDNSIIVLDLNFQTPGDGYTFYVDVVNNGTIDAMLDTFGFQNLAEGLEDYLLIDISYLDGITVSRYDLLAANSSETLRVTCSYSQDFDLDDLPDEDLPTSLNLVVNYLQADSNATVRQHGTITEGSPVVTNKVSTMSGNNNWLTKAVVVFDIEDEEAIIDAKYCVDENNCTPNIAAPLQNDSFTYTFGDNNVSKKVCLSVTNIFDRTTTQCSDSYLADSVAPTLTNLEVTQGDNSISVNVTGSDNGSGIYRYYYSKDGGNTFISSSNSNYTFTSLENGNYTIVIYAEDNAGNITGEQEVVVPLGT